VVCEPTVAAADHLAAVLDELVTAADAEDARPAQIEAFVRLLEFAVVAIPTGLTQTARQGA
jgi:hypothetical protein